MKDNVNNPYHYNQYNIQVIDIIEHCGLNYHYGNALKYLLRAPFKTHFLEDLQKAEWYLNRGADTYCIYQGDCEYTYNISNTLITYGMDILASIVVLFLCAEFEACINTLKDYIKQLINQKEHSNEDY